MDRVEKAPAKINLSLRVFEKRSDGYHRLETVMVKLNLCDDVRLTLQDAPGVEIRVPGYSDLETPENLAVRAAQAYFQAANIQRGLRIEIQKRIPVAAGLGGGSSDAAAVLRGLDHLMEGRLSNRMFPLASQLGADIPFLLHEAAMALCRGVGEEISPWPALPERPVVLVHPGYPVSTGEVFTALERPLTWNHPNDTPIALSGEPKSWNDLKGLFLLGNDLQPVVQGRYPDIKAIRDALLDQGAQWAQLSGSGATVFGLFERDIDAKKAAERLPNKWKAFVTRTVVKSPGGR